MGIFYREEKVFSLARSAAAVPFENLTQMFEEFYCYLLVTGLFLEGRPDRSKGVQWALPKISDRDFGWFWDTCYCEGLGKLLVKGLKDRFTALYAHRDVNDHELAMLAMIDGLFTPDHGFYHGLSGKSLLSIALSRGFSNDMRVVAKYVAAMYSQHDDIESGEIPQLYLSAFGNIHLSKEETTVLKAPVLRYGSKSAENNGETVSALWSMLSAQVGDLSKDKIGYRSVGDRLGDILSMLTFLGGRNQNTSISIPRYAATLYSQRIIGIDRRQPAEIAIAFYRDFFFGNLSVTEVDRSGFLRVVLDLMMNAVGEDRQFHLFADNSYYQRLTQERFTPRLQTQRPSFLDYAIEALDSKPSADDSVENDDDTNIDQDAETPSQTPERDPQTEDGGYDPSSPPAAMPITATTVPENTMGLLSFDKTGEGVNEALYREAVVALNDRIQGDDTIDISVATKTALNDWVSWYLYRTAIAETKAQIAVLNLQSYLKTVSPQG